MKKLRKQVILIITLLIICFTFSSCFGVIPDGSSKFEAIEEDKINFIQFEKPKVGDEIAIIETDLGTVKMRLFRNESPEAVENFTTLVKEGYYTDHKVIKITTNRAFITANKDGGGKSIYNDPFKNTYSDNLWHFPGTVSAISDKEGYGDSRFYIVGNAKVEDKIFNEMTKSNFPKKVIEKYRELGGTPELDRGCTIFGQVFEGLDVVDKINASETNELGAPKSDIIIKSITLSTFN